MANSTIGVLQPGSPSHFVDTERLTVGANTVERERMQIAGDDATDIAPVTAANGLLVDVSRVAGSVATALSKVNTATLANVLDTAVSTTLLAENANRIKFIIYNDSTVKLYVKYGATASATSFTYILDPGGSLAEDRYTGVVDGIWASDGSGSARVTEL